MPRLTFSVPLAVRHTPPAAAQKKVQAESDKMCMQIYRYYQECGCQLKHLFWPCQDGPTSNVCHHVQCGVVVKPDALCPYHERVEATRPYNRPDTLSRRTDPRRRLFQVNWNTYMKTFHIPPHPRDKLESSADSPWGDSGKDDDDDDDEMKDGSEASESADWCYNWDDRIPWTYADGGGPEWELDYDTGYESGVEETDKQRRRRLQLKKRLIQKRIARGRNKKPAKCGTKGVSCHLFADAAVLDKVTWECLVGLENRLYLAPCEESQGASHLAFIGLALGLGTDDSRIATRSRELCLGVPDSFAQEFAICNKMLVIKKEINKTYGLSYLTSNVGSLMEGREILLVTYGRPLFQGL
ncbi:hypothetical protein ACRALDRAFT_211047 [Sodiomyces alcalophilus JCM 7366]|uniref:uncharacterized protein n=1 Tax=Sodiomyces alcalophilus JCM 7366 TaxID=591952 RepID=UPI0039B37BF5